MGCRQSNTWNRDTQSNHNDIDIVKNLNEVNLIPESDPRIPLTIRQMFKLKQSWKGIKRKIDEAGVEMFVR